MDFFDPMLADSVVLQYSSKIQPLESDITVVASNLKNVSTDRVHKSERSFVFNPNKKFKGKNCLLNSFEIDTSNCF